jgi:hypothetical protein
MYLIIALIIIIAGMCFLVYTMHLNPAQSRGISNIIVLAIIFFLLPTYFIIYAIKDGITDIDNPSALFTVGFYIVSVLFAIADAIGKVK